MLGESAEGIMAACEHSLAAANTITRVQTPEQQGAGPLQQQVMPCMPPCSSLLLGAHSAMQVGTPLCSSGPLKPCRSTSCFTHSRQSAYP